jgi:hypothetical protein
MRGRNGKSGVAGQSYQIFNNTYLKERESLSGFPVSSIIMTRRNTGCSDVITPLNKFSVTKRRPHISDVLTSLPNLL